MTDKVKLRIEGLRWAHHYHDCTDGKMCCPVINECFRSDSTLCNLRDAADMIEALVAELEQVKRERDTAVKDLKLWNCFSCKNAGYAHSEICASCGYNRVRIAKGYVSGRNLYEWRGAKEGE